MEEHGLKSCATCRDVDAIASPFLTTSRQVKQSGREGRDRRTLAGRRDGGRGCGCEHHAKHKHTRRASSSYDRCTKTFADLRACALNRQLERNCERQEKLDDVKSCTAADTLAVPSAGLRPGRGERGGRGAPTHTPHTSLTLVCVTPPRPTSATPPLR